MTRQCCGQLTNKKRYISIFTRPMELKLSRLVTQDAENFANIVTWYINYRVKWRIKNATFLLSQAIWTPNLASWWLRTRELHLQSHVTLQYRDYMKNKKVLYFYFHKVYGPQNFIGCWNRMKELHPKSDVTLQLPGQDKNQKRHMFSTPGPSRSKKKA